MSQKYIKVLATLSFVVVAAASQAALILQSVPAFYDNSGGADQYTMLNQFNPALGSLTAVGMFYYNVAYGQNTVTNIDGTPGTFSNMVYSESYLSVYDSTATYGLVDDLVVSNSASGIALAGGASNTISAGNGYYAFQASYDPSFLAAYTGMGSVYAYQASLGYAGGSGDHQVQNGGFEESASAAVLIYQYNAVPAPAAAGTMLIGMIGGFVRRKRSA